MSGSNQLTNSNTIFKNPTKWIWNLLHSFWEFYTADHCIGGCLLSATTQKTGTSRRRLSDMLQLFWEFLCILFWMPLHLLHIGSAGKYTSCGTCPEPGHLTAIALQSGLVWSPRAGRAAGAGDPHLLGANRDVVLRIPPWLFLHPLRHQKRLHGVRREPGIKLAVSAGRWRGLSPLCAHCCGCLVFLFTVCCASARPLPPLLHGGWQLVLSQYSLHNKSLVLIFHKNTFFPQEFIQHLPLQKFKHGRKMTV